MSAGHPLSHRASVHLEEFKNDKLILFDDSKGPYNGFNNYILDLWDKRQIKPQSILYTQQVDTLGLAIQETGGVSMFFARVNSSILQNKFPTPCLGKFAKRLGQ